MSNRVTKQVIVIRDGSGRRARVPDMEGSGSGGGLICGAPCSQNPIPVEFDLGLTTGAMFATEGSGSLPRA